MDKELKVLYNSLTTAGNYPISTVDIRNILNTPVFQYDDLKNLNSIDDVLPREKDAVILYVRNENSNIGHWTVLSRIGDVVEYFDSYGEMPQNKDVINLVRKSGYKLIINKKRFQKLQMTCGFHCIFRVFCLLYKNMNLNDYINFMKTPTDHDRAVIFYISMLVNLKFNIV